MHTHPVKIIANRRTYQGTFTAPASKSYLQRAIALGALNATPCEITGFYPSKDALAACEIVQAMGAKVEIQNTQLTLTPIAFEALQNTVTLNCGEAGLSTRMFGAIAPALFPNVTLTGKGSILQRPMQMVIDALQQLGCAVTANNGFLPIHITHTLQPKEICIDGSESSQLLTGLLIALPLLSGDSIVHVHQLASIPYIQMTLDILQDFGIVITHSQFQRFDIQGNQRPSLSQYTVEGDWSGAAFHLVGGAISGNVSVKGLQSDSSQADKAILAALSTCGAHLEIQKNDIFVAKKNLQSFTFDATHCPDLFPPLAVLAAACEGTSTIIGTQRLMHKESNRALSLQSELSKLGIVVTQSENALHITGGKVNGGLVHSHNDHRIAMAMCVLASLADAPIEIEQYTAVEKSYPDFFDVWELVTI